MNRRRFAALALLLWSSLAGAAVVELRVFDAFGSSYSTTRMGEQLGSLYDLDFEARMVLILGPNLSDQRVQEQEDIVATIDPSEHGILYAIGTPTQTYMRGFNITPNDAASLLPGPDSFRVLVLGPTGRVLYESDQVVSRETLVQVARRR